MWPCKWFNQPGEKFNTAGGYIHKPRRGVFGFCHCLVGKEMHSLSSRWGQICSEAWGWGPGCGLPDASLRSAEGWTLESVNNSRDRWMERWNSLGQTLPSEAFFFLNASQVGFVQTDWCIIKGIVQHFRNPAWWEDIVELTCDTTMNSSWLA